MWMDAYVQDILIRQQIADAQQRAAINHLLRGARPARARRGMWQRMSRLLRLAGTPGREKRSIALAPPASFGGYR